MPKNVIDQNFVGYNSSKYPHNIPPNYLTKSSYVDYAGTVNSYVFQGAAVPRNKFAIYNGMTAKVGPILGMKAHKNIGNSDDKIRIVSQFLASTTTCSFEVVKFDAGGTPSLTALTGTFSTTYPCKFEFFNNVMYLSNGLATPYKYFLSGTTDYWEPQGVQQPDTPASGGYSSTGGSGGFEAGVTKYRYSFVYSVGSVHEVEGPVSGFHNITTDVDVGGRCTMNLTGPDNNNAQNHYTSFRIYRKHPSQPSWYFVEDVAITAGMIGSSTVNYQDDDGTLFDLTRPAFEVNDQDLEFEGNTQLASAHYGIRMHKGRMWYAFTDNKTLQFSEPNLPESCPTANQFIVGGSNDPFTELISSKGILYIVKKFSIWWITGTNRGNFKLEQVANFGSYLPNMTFTYEGYLYGANQKGIWRWAGDGPPEYISDQIQRDFDESQTSWPNYYTTTLAAQDYDLDAYLDYEILARYNWSVDKQTGYIWFDCAYDSDTGLMLGAYVFDPSAGKFMGKVVFPHNGASQIELGAGNSYLMCGHRTSTDEWKYAILHNFSGSSIFSSDWVDEGIFFQSIQTGGLVSPGMLKLSKISYLQFLFSDAVSIIVYYDDYMQNSLKQITAGQAISEKQLFNLNAGLTGMGASIFMTNTGTTLNTLIGFGIDTEEIGKW